MIEGVGLEEVATETVSRHTDAFSDDPVLRNSLEVGGEYLFRMRGEAHMWSPDAVASLAACGSHGLLVHLQGVLAADGQQRRGGKVHPRPVQDQDRRRNRPGQGAARRSDAGSRDRQAVLDRRDVVRFDQPRGAHDAGASP